MKLLKTQEREFQNPFPLWKIMRKVNGGMNSISLAVTKK